MFEDILQITSKVELEEVSLLSTSKVNSKKLAKKINQFFDKLSMPTPDISELENSIEGLTDNAKEALVGAVKEQDTHKIVSILGLKDIVKIGPKLKYE